MLGGPLCCCGMLPKFFGDLNCLKVKFPSISYAHNDWKGARGRQKCFAADFGRNRPFEGENLKKQLFKLILSTVCGFRYAG